MFYEYEEVEKLNKKLYKANKTIVTLCNYLNKLTNDEKALKKANKELIKAKKFIKFEDDKVKLLDKMMKFYTENEEAD